MRKLYTQYTNSELNTPFMVIFEGNQVQACANDGDTITIGSTEYVRVTDGSGHDVKAVIPNSGDETPHKLIVRLGEGNVHNLCYIEDDEAVSSTSIQVTDIVVVSQYTFTINPTPADASVTINGESRTSITVDDGTTVSYTVEASGYVSQSGTYTLDGANHTENIVLVPVPVPQETVIEYTASGWSYSTTYSGEGEIPANAYLTFDLVNRPPAGTAIADYNVDCGFMGGDPASSPYIVHAEGLGYTSSVGYLPIKSGIPQDTEDEIGRLAITGDENIPDVAECIKKVTLNADSSCEIEVEAIPAGTTRTINVTGANNHIDFSEVKSQINSTETVDALRHFGQYLAFAFVDSQQQTHNNAPVVKLHIPSA